MVRFGVLNVPNLTISQIQFGISQVRFGTDHPKSKFQFGMSQIEIPIWDIPGLIWNMGYNNNTKINSRFLQIFYLDIGCAKEEEINSRVYLVLDFECAREWKEHN